MTKEDKVLVDRMKNIRELLAEFGLELRGYDPGISANIPNKYGTLQLEKFEWEWLEPLLVELRANRKLIQKQRDKFLNEVYKLAKIDSDTAADKIFDFIDCLLCDGSFDVCDEVLKNVDVEKLPTQLMRSFLSMTAAAKDKLPSRPDLYGRIKKKMIESRGVKTTRRIIGNLV